MERPKPDRRNRRFGELMLAAGRKRAVSRPILALLRAEGRVNHEFEDALAPAGVSIPQFNILMEAAASDPDLALSEIARRLVKSAPNITSLVDRLERDGLIRRNRSLDDRRVVTATVTERGWDALRMAAPVVFAAERRMIAGLGAEERATIGDLLDRVAR